MLNKIGKLKKSACILMIAASLSLGAVCSASDSSDLNSQQKIVDTFIDAIDGNGAPDYIIFSKGLSAQLKSNVNEQSYSVLQNQVKSSFGTLKEAKFFNYERYDQGDRITYLASFTNQPAVSMIFVFDTDKKLVDFALTPIDMQQGN